VVTLAFLLGAVASTQASHLFSDVAGHTTLERVVVGDRINSSSPYSNLRSEAVNRTYVVRDPAGLAQGGRDQRRKSLSYFGQLTDFQLADEESPARVEFTDQDPSGTAASAWRPQEALQPFVIDWSLRQMNLFTGASPVPQGDGSRAAMDFALMTGDQADNMERNEILWTRALLEGTSLNPNSGSSNPADYNATQHPSCAVFADPTDPTGISAAARAEAPKYTGVQDYDDYDEGGHPYFYDPDFVKPGTFWAMKGWPTYPGLMDRAQLPFQPAGLNVPSYVTNGNHDGLVQGNEDANQAFEDIATGCFKTLSTTQNVSGLDPNVLLFPGNQHMNVPPDPLRRFVDKAQIKALYEANGMDNGHGYDFVDQAEEDASNGSASYYAWDPPEAPGFRFISIDTLAEGGVVGVTDSGNIDHPQFQWLENELDAATARDKLIVIFGHHPVRSLTADVGDEEAGSCTPPNANWGDTPEHNHNPGCDQDPRPSVDPGTGHVHLGKACAQPPTPKCGRQPGDTTQTFTELLANYNHVIAYVAGHTHENKILACGLTSGCSGNGNWWEINTSATADWPVQHRVVEVMDNRDGTLSLFGTILDHAAAAQAPPSGSAAMAMDEAQLASIGRVFAYNDPQAGIGSGEGTEQDQNVELLVRDPRQYTRPVGASPIRVSLVPAFEPCETGDADSTHGSPLAFPSCALPQQRSSTTTIGPNSLGFARWVVCPAGTAASFCNPAGSLPKPDMRLTGSIRDVRCRGSTPAGCVPGGDYNPNSSAGPYTSGGDGASAAAQPPCLPSGTSQAACVAGTDLTMVAELPGATTGATGTQFEGKGVRITDADNGGEPGTVVDIGFPVPIDCLPTVSSSGSTCGVNTTANALAPGVVKNGMGAIWQLGEVEITDSGPDGTRGNADDEVFAVQGVYLP
jgi:3',5'-cyclic AMP phosphodiesterase CpdA